MAACPQALQVRQSQLSHLSSQHRKKKKKQLLVIFLERRTEKVVLLFFFLFCDDENARLRASQTSLQGKKYLWKQWLFRVKQISW